MPCLRQFYNKSWGLPSPFLTYKRLKLKLRVFSAGHIVAMFSYYVAQLTATSLSKFRHFFDSIILASTDVEWL